MYVNITLVKRLQEFNLSGNALLFNVLFPAHLSIYSLKLSHTNDTTPSETTDASPVNSFVSVKTSWKIKLLPFEKW
jgi:hypothetical protein